MSRESQAQSSRIADERHPHLRDFLIGGSGRRRPGPAAPAVAIARQGLGSFRAGAPIWAVNSAGAYLKTRGAIVRTASGNAIVRALS